ncbi:MAG: hypothetical protein WD023_10130 [Ilumatobacteraceae bacterium]
MLGFSSSPLLALSLDSAKQLAIVLVIAFVVLTIVSAMIIKNITTKIIMVVLFGGFALGVWTQRTNLQSCADTVRAKADVGDLSATNCTFFGADVEIPGVSLPG